MTASTSRVTLAAAAITSLIHVAACSSSEPSDPFTHPEQHPNWGSAGSGGAGPATGGSGGATAGSRSGLGGLVTAGAAAADPDIIEVWPSDGCGKPYEGPSGNTVIILPTAGLKDELCNDKLQNGMARCGAWGQPSSSWLSEPLPRDYYVYLPATYDSSKPYPLVFQGHGCGGNGTQVYSLSDGSGPNAGNRVIRVGLTPAPSTIIGHGCCPFGCFDDKEGDDSVDFVFYETLYDKLNEELCFDRNRVFAAGHSSGGWLANELACKYAGDATRPIRAPLANSGGLPVSPAEVPTCTSAPVAGMWVHDTSDQDYAFSSALVSINRAMALDGCAIADYEQAAKENFPIGGGVAPDVCKRIIDCHPLYPLVVCALPGPSRGSHDNVANPGFSTFLSLFSFGELITPQP